MNTNIEPRIYVACLASYNNGVLHGEWIDATTDEDEMQEEINRILRDSKFCNVVVECPACEGESIIEYCEGQAKFCPECKGHGEVPSAEEWAILDHEGLGDLGEYSGLQEVARRVALAEVAEEWNVPLAVLIEALTDHHGDTDANAEEFMQDHFSNSADTWADFAEEYHTDVACEEIPDWLVYHIDWESVGRELQHSYNGIRHDGKLYVFHQ